MKQLKIIHGNTIDNKRLDERVNEWIQEMGDSISVIDIRVNMAIVGASLGLVSRDAYIIYEVVDREEENNDEIRP